MIVPFPTPDGPHTINGFRTFGFSEAIDVSSGEILENKTGLFDKQFTNVVVVGSFPELRLVRTLLENALIFDVSKKMKYTVSMAKNLIDCICYNPSQKWMKF